MPGTDEEGCLGGNTDPGSPECAYGDADSGDTWAVVGDSHIDQYLPALVAIAEDRGVRLVTFLHANCPFNASQTPQDQEWGSPCHRANAGTAERLNELEADLVITSNWTTGEWASDPVEGFVEAWSRVPAPVVVIADNPEMKPADGTTACVVENYPDTYTCALPREEALPVDYQLPAAAQAAREQPQQVHVLDFTDAYCTADVCPPVIGNVMVYRDPHHITATYMTTLTPTWIKNSAESGRIG